MEHDNVIKHYVYLFAIIVLKILNTLCTTAWWSHFSRGLSYGINRTSLSVSVAAYFSCIRPFYFHGVGNTAFLQSRIYVIYGTTRRRGRYTIVDLLLKEQTWKEKSNCCGSSKRKKSQIHTRPTSSSSSSAYLLAATSSTSSAWKKNDWLCFLVYWNKLSWCCAIFVPTGFIWEPFFSCRGCVVVELSAE